MNLTFSVLKERLAIYKFGASNPVDQKWFESSFASVTKTEDELSVVISENITISGEPLKMETGWRGLKVEGKLDFSLVGIIAKVSNVLAEGGVSIYTISTYDTDYILVKNENLEKAKNLLIAAGYLFI